MFFLLCSPFPLSSHSDKGLQTGSYCTKSSYTPLLSISVTVQGYFPLLYLVCWAGLCFSVFGFLLFIPFDKALDQITAKELLCPPKYPYTKQKCMWLILKVVRKIKKSPWPKTFPISDTQMSCTDTPFPLLFLLWISEIEAVLDKSGVRKRKSCCKQLLWHRSVKHFGCHTGLPLGMLWDYSISSSLHEIPRRLKLHSMTKEKQ